MTIVIREAREGEIEKIGRVLTSAFDQHRPANGVGIDPAYLDAFERYFDEVVNVRARLGEAQLFVAVEDDRILGTGTLYPPGRGREYGRAVLGKPWPGEWASLRLLAVDPAHRGRGVGRMLLEARVTRARELRAPVVALHSSQEFAEARRMIQRMGWKRSPEFDHTPAPGVYAEAYVLPLG